MSKIIGPIDRDTWNTLRLLKGSIAYDRAQNNPKLNKSIDWQTEEYNFFMNGVLQSAA